MNQNELDELHEVKKIIKRHTMWSATKYVYWSMSPDYVEKIAEIVDKLLENNSDAS